MKKIIVKVKLKNKDEFEKKLSDIDLDFTPIIWQHDRIYVPRGFKRGTNMPRITMRTEMKAVDKPAKYEMILKRHIEDSKVNIVNATVVKDYAEAVNLVHQLGFEKIAEVSRRRQLLIMGEGVRIYLDHVEGVPGFYAKIESEISDKDKVAEVIADLESTFRVLGANDFVEQTYFELLK